VHDVFFDAQDAMLEALARAWLAELPLRRGGHLSEVSDRPDAPPAS
jgi:hypothetical protein